MTPSTFKAKITEIKKSGTLHVIKATSGADVLHVDTLELVEVSEGDMIELGVKPTKIALSLEKPKNTTIENQIKCKVINATCSELLCELDLRAIDSDLFLQAFAKKHLIASLKIKKNDTIYALIAANELFIKGVSC